MKSYNMDETLEVSKQGTVDIIKYLKNLPETINIINVEDDLIHQKKDIDRLWLLESDGVLYRIPIEIKVDRHYNSGNYFFETVSNLSKNTNGCFNYTKAELLLYYFPQNRELHIMKMDIVREWFNENSNRFRSANTSTNINGNKIYGSIGKLIPRQVAIDETKGIKVVYI